MARPRRDGDKDPRCDRLGKVRAALLCEIFSYLPHGGHPAVGDSFHHAVIVERRSEVHFVPAIFLNAFPVGNNLYLGHVLAVMQHGVKILGVLVGHFATSRCKDIVFRSAMQ